MFSQFFTLVMCTQFQHELNGKQTKRNLHD